jgi:flagellar export protein FliJ
MRRRRPLHTLQRLAEHGADAASRDVGQRLRALRAEEERLRQVRGFLDHYEQLSVKGGEGLTVGRVQSRRQFAARLRDAAERQRQVVAEQETHYHGQMERWRAARAHALALQRFNERTRARELERRERREQSRLDEIALRRR